MKKLQLPIKELLLSTLLLISCTENEQVVEEETCIGDNYTIQIDKLLNKLTTVHPGNLPTTRNYEYTYNAYNLLEESYENTFDYGVYRVFDYVCNNNLSIVTNKENLKYDLKYDETGRLTSYKTESSYLHDYTLTYTENSITVSGIINKKPNTTIMIETNNDDLVTKITRADNYSIFEYDMNGNVIKATDYSNNGIIINEYQITYDTNPNPFYGQFKSNYLERFIDMFSESTFFGIDIFFRFNQYKFPFFKNNPVLLEDLSCTLCYKDLIKRTYEYDAQNYPLKMEESYVGSPAVLYEYEYQ